MKKNIKPIQGRQISPNPINPECIRVTKVYDWVVLTNRERNRVNIPEECLAQIEACRDAGGTITATCTEVEGSRSCDLVGTREAPEQFGPSAQIATLAFHVHLQLEFFCDGAPIPGCTFVVPVTLVDDVLLCFPEGTVINCNIFEVQCNVILNQMFGNTIMVDVLMCKDIQVEAEVKLEVEAKFCGPRADIPIPEEEAVCPVQTFPPQCPAFFPPLNCECQGAGNFEGTASITYAEMGGTAATATGQLDITALVCDQCNLASSNLSVSFVEIPGSGTPTPEDDLDRSFTFTANDFEQPTCGADTLTVTGTGIFTPAGGAPENAVFTLTLTDNPTDPELDALTLIITSPSAAITIPLTGTLNEGLEVEIEECERF